MYANENGCYVVEDAIYVTDDAMCERCLATLAESEIRDGGEREKRAGFVLLLTYQLERV